MVFVSFILHKFWLQIETFSRVNQYFLDESVKETLICDCWVRMRSVSVRCKVLNLCLLMTFVSLYPGLCIYANVHAWLLFLTVYYIDQVVVLGSSTTVLKLHNRHSAWFWNLIFKAYMSCQSRIRFSLLSCQRISTMPSSEYSWCLRLIW